MSLTTAERRAQTSRRSEYIRNKLLASRQPDLGIDDGSPAPRRITRLADIERLYSEAAARVDAAPPAAPLPARPRPEVPLLGVRVVDLEALCTVVRDGRRVLRADGAPGHVKIEAPHPIAGDVNVPISGALSSCGVTAVLAPDAPLEAGMRLVKAAVWDNVVVNPVILAAHGAGRGYSPLTLRRCAFATVHCIVPASLEALSPREMATLLFKWDDRDDDGYVGYEDNNAALADEGERARRQLSWEQSCADAGVADVERGFTEAEYVAAWTTSVSSLSPEEGGEDGDATPASLSEELNDDAVARLRARFTLFAAASALGCVGKVTEFVAGTNGDGSDDIYVVSSLTEAQVDPQLLTTPTIGWGGDGDAATTGRGAVGGDEAWPRNFLYDKAIDKEWQGDASTPLSAKHLHPTLIGRAVSLRLSAEEFTRYTAYVTCDDVLQLAVLPQCNTTLRSYSFCEVLAECGIAPRGDATHFVSLAQTYDFARVVATLREWRNGELREEEPRLWLAMTSLDQFKVCVMSHFIVSFYCLTEYFTNLMINFNEYQLKEWASAAVKFNAVSAKGDARFAKPTQSREAEWLSAYLEKNRSIVARIGHTLPIVMPWQSPVSLASAWCIYELYESVRNNDTNFLVAMHDLEDDGENRTTWRSRGATPCATTLLMPEKERAAMASLLLKDRDEFSLAVERVVAGVRLEESEGRAVERHAIVDCLTRLREGGGGGGGGGDRGAALCRDVNDAVREALRTWLTQLAKRELAIRLKERELVVEASSVAALRVADESGGGAVAPWAKCRPFDVPLDEEVVAPNPTEWVGFF